MKSCFFLCWVCMIMSCSSDSVRQSRICITIYGGSGGKIYLSKVPYIGETGSTLDSAICQSPKDSIIFHVEKQDDRLYELFVRGAVRKFYFVPDAPDIHLKLNVVTGRSSSTGSAVTASLMNFNSSQDLIIRHSQKIRVALDSLRKNGDAHSKLMDSVSGSLKDSLALIEKQNRNYADTVSNPAAFMAVYSNIEFGDDRRQLGEFIQRAARRFPKTPSIQQLSKEVMDMISIFEMEFNVGDTLPVIALPDLNGFVFSTASLKGKYYLIDFWSTYCHSCAAYDAGKRELYAKMPVDKFQLVSVALDDNRRSWSMAVRQANLPWIQLIDEKMWRGLAAKTLKFDSIPFNFLVSPTGRILAKAIRPDSLEFSITHAVK